MQQIVEVRPPNRLTEWLDRKVPNGITRAFVAGACCAWPAVAFSFFEWLAVSPLPGTRILVWALVLLEIPALLIKAVLPFAWQRIWMLTIGFGIVLLPRRTRLLVLRLGAGAVGFSLIVFPSILAGLGMRQRAFESLAERSAPLVEAIHALEDQRGHAPESLARLVPEFLAEVPSTGMGAYPNYDYATGDDVWNRTCGEWSLQIECSSGFINWDCFLYLPNKDSIGVDGGGGYEPFGDWLYFHE